MNRDKHYELNELGLTGSERDAMERMLTGFRESAHQQAQRPELFWDSMRTRVAAHIRTPQAHRGLGWAATLAAISAMVVFVAVPSHTPVRNPGSSTTAVSTTQPISDEALLRSVADTASSDVPDALAPATVLTSEMDRGLADGANKLTGRNNQ